MKLLSLGMVLLLFGAVPTCQLSADLVVIDTDTLSGTLFGVDNNADDIADTGSASATYTLTGLTLSGVTFDVSFDLAAVGGFINNPSSSSNDEVGIWSNTVAELSTGSNARLVNRASEGFIANNFQITNVSNGVATFNGIRRVGMGSAVGASDAGSFTVSGVADIGWDDLNDGTVNNAFDGAGLDGSGDASFDLNGAYLAAGGTGLINSFQLNHSGTASNAWTLDAIEFDVSLSAAVPEPTSLLMFGMILGGLGFRRRKP